MLSNVKNYYRKFWSKHFIYCNYSDFHHRTTQVLLKVKASEKMLRYNEWLVMLLILIFLLSNDWARLHVFSHQHVQLNSLIVAPVRTRGILRIVQNFNNCRVLRVWYAMLTHLSHKQHLLLITLPCSASLRLPPRFRGSFGKT